MLKKKERDEDFRISFFFVELCFDKPRANLATFQLPLNHRLYKLNLMP